MISHKIVSDQEKSWIGGKKNQQVAETVEAMNGHLLTFSHWSLPIVDNIPFAEEFRSLCAKIPLFFETCSLFRNVA